MFENRDYPDGKPVIALFVEVTDRRPSIIGAWIGGDMAYISIVRIQLMNRRLPGRGFIPQQARLASIIATIII